MMFEYKETPFHGFTYGSVAMPNMFVEMWGKVQQKTVVRHQREKKSFHVKIGKTFIHTDSYIFHINNP